MKDATGSFSGGLYGLALLGLIAAFVCALFLHIPNRLPASRRSARRPSDALGTWRGGAAGLRFPAFPLQGLHAR